MFTGKETQGFISWLIADALLTPLTLWESCFPEELLSIIERDQCAPYVIM